MAWGSHRLTKSTLAYRWGWRPTKSQDDFLQDYRDEIKAVLEGNRTESISGCLAKD